MIIAKIVIDLISRLKKVIIKPISLFLNLNRLKKSNFKVNFLNEGNIEISIPKLNILDALLLNTKQLKNQYQFSTRPNKEALLRKVIYILFEEGYLDRKKSIIDIGCWLADNTLVWAKFLHDGPVVHAIDPSVENLKFGKKLGKLNGITNVNWVQAVCSNTVGAYLDFNGSIDHAEFEESKIKSDETLVSTTLDNVIQSSNHQEISLIHLDVEGFEEQVLQGAKNIIELNKPTIVFEHHISEKDIRPIINFLKFQDYSIFMINVVLPGNNLDCRNFIAFDNKKAIPKNIEVKHHLGRDKSIYYASLHGALIPLDGIV